MFSISALFNIYPAWVENWMLGVTYTAMVLLMGAIPLGFPQKFVPWSVKVPIVPIGVILCYMLINGAGEQVSKVRDVTANGDDAKIARYGELDTLIKQKGIELEGYTQALNWRVGSQENVNAAQTAFDSSMKHKNEICEKYPAGNLCNKEEPAAVTKAQTALTNATNDWEWTKGKKRLEKEIPDLQVEQRELHAPKDNPQAVAAARTAKFWRRFGIVTDGKNINDDRPMEIASTGELMSFFGPAFMFYVIHGFFEWLRSRIRRRKNVLPQVVIEPMQSLQTTAQSLQIAAASMQEPLHASMQISTEPEQIAALKPARAESVLEWGDVRVSKLKGGKIATAAVRRDYESWCADREEKPVTSKRFGMLISELGAYKEEKDTRNYHGIALKPSLKLVRSG